jgi:Tol biopolymer transport system component
VYDLERYLNVRSAYGASMGPEGRLAFLLNTTGVGQLWTLDAPGEWPEQRTFYDEPVGFIDYSPTRAELVFGMDEGGNERTQLYRLNDDGTVTELTAMPDAKHRWGGWGPDGDVFAFASNRRDEAVFDVYVQDRDATGDDADRVYEGDGWFTVNGWSPDGEKLAISEAHSSFDQDVYVLDIESGERTHLTPHEGSVRYSSVSWGPEGDALYLVTDAESDNWNSHGSRCRANSTPSARAVGGTSTASPWTRIAAGWPTPGTSRGTTNSTSASSRGRRLSRSSRRRISPAGWPVAWPGAPTPTASPSVSPAGR